MSMSSFTKAFILMIIISSSHYCSSVPRPVVSITPVGSAVNALPFTATCLARFVAAVPMDLVNITITNVEGLRLAEIDDRVTESQIRQINASTYARDLTVNRLRIDDTGTYICEASLVRREFIRSELGYESLDVVVFGESKLS